MAVCIQGGSISGGGQLPGMSLHPGGLHPRDLPTSGVAGWADPPGSAYRNEGLGRGLPRNTTYKG